jgi:DNA-directed RNA polymerase subunit H (RpoH/RPB5)
VEVVSNSDTQIKTSSSSKKEKKKKTKSERENKTVSKTLEPGTSTDKSSHSTPSSPRIGSRDDTQPQPQSQPQSQPQPQSQATFQPSSNSQSSWRRASTSFGNNQRDPAATVPSNNPSTLSLGPATVTSATLTKIQANDPVLKALNEFKLRVDNMTLEGVRTELHAMMSTNDLKRETLQQKELLELVAKLMEENKRLNQQVAHLQKQLNEKMYAHAIETDITKLVESTLTQITECCVILKNKIIEAQTKAKNDINALVIPDETLRQRVVTLQTIAYYVEDSLYLNKMIRLQNEKLTHFYEKLKEHKTRQEKILQELHDQEKRHKMNQKLEHELKVSLTTFTQPFEELKALLNDNITTISDSKLQQVLNNIRDQNKKTRQKLKRICKNDDNIKTEIRARGEIVDIVSYEEYEVDTKDIKFDFHEDKEDAVPTVKAATINKLIERLTSSKYSDVSFREAFLLTYQSFMTSTELLQKLIERYCMTPVDKNVSAEVLESLKQKQSPIRARVLHVIRRWIEKYYHDFSNQEFERYLLDFLQNTVAKTGFERQAEPVIALYHKRKSGVDTTTEVKTSVQKPPDPILPPKMQFTGVMDLSPTELARQITLLEQQLFKAIKPYELQNQCWTKPDKYEKAPNVMNMINHATRISMWVVTEIMKHETVVKRAECCKKFIDLALECQKISNFNAVMEIIGGLGNAAIIRLKHTWKEVDRQKFAELERLRRYSEQNYRDLRAAVHSAPQPVIPFLGVYLTDLTYVEDGAVNRVGHLINFQKLSKIAEYILEIQQYQQGAYNFVPISILQNYILKMKLLTNEEAFSLSLKYEPRLDKSLMSSQQL